MLKGDISRGLLARGLKMNDVMAPIVIGGLADVENASRVDIGGRSKVRKMFSARCDSGGAAGRGADRAADGSGGARRIKNCGTYTVDFGNRARVVRPAVAAKCLGVGTKMKEVMMTATRVDVMVIAMTGADDGVPGSTGGTRARRLYTENFRSLRIGRGRPARRENMGTRQQCARG